jgi:hypothetical protein
MAPLEAASVSSITFTFMQPINFFSGWFTGVENGCGQTRVEWLAESFLLPNSSVNNVCGATTGVQFFGVLSQTPFTTVTFLQRGARSPNARDFWAVDDLFFGATADTVVPEPATNLLLATGLVGVCCLSRKLGRRRT